MLVSRFYAGLYKVLLLNPKGPSSPYLWFLVPKKARKFYNREHLDPLCKPCSRSVDLRVLAAGFGLWGPGALRLMM